VFAFCYWQNGEILHIVNRPVEHARALNPNKPTSDPLEQSALFERRVGAAMQALGPALAAVQASNATPAQRRAIATAAEKLRDAAKITPTATTRQPVTFGVTEPFLTTFKVAGYAAILLTLPIILYQLYAFLLPAFTPRERGAILPLLVMVPVLFFAGVAFGYLVALPRAAHFLLNFNASHFDILLRAQDYYSFTVLFLAAVGLLFEVPILVLALTRLEIVTPRQLRKNRGYVVLGVAIVAAVVTPTPDPVTMLLTMAPMLVLFELSILLASILDRRRAAAATLEDLDPTPT
jgi:sec-independent protein translocase protein TatC